MPEPTVCRTCRFWQLLRDGALIGRCRKPESLRQFPRGVDSCGYWEACPQRPLPSLIKAPPTPSR
jgi:hypothetical protein